MIAGCRCSRCCTRPNRALSPHQFSDLEQRLASACSRSQPLRFYAAGKLPAAQLAKPCAAANQMRCRRNEPQQTRLRIAIECHSRGSQRGRSPALHRASWPQVENGIS
ncbi:hypothetical protein KCP70_12080 [Salmonella enterica subsp. enterica]|nr:hypothetical protein KCP70_12080 [Salmonella enterica subsp. enterica]